MSSSSLAVRVLKPKTLLPMTKVLEALFDELRPSVTQLVKEAVAEALEKGVPHYPERVPISIASEITGYSVNSLYQMNHRRQVPGAIKVGGKLMFETKVLQDWVKKGGNAA